MSDSLWPHGLQHNRPPCRSPTPRPCSNSCPTCQWCHPTISFTVIPFSSCLQSFPASGSFPMSQFFTSGGQSIGVSASASVLPMNTQDWFPLGWTGWISLLSKGLLRVFSNTTVQKHLVIQWLRIHFPMQGMGVPSLVGELHRTTRPPCHNWRVRGHNERSLMMQWGSCVLQPRLGTAQ